MDISKIPVLPKQRKEAFQALHHAVQIPRRSGARPDSSIGLGVTMDNWKIYNKTLYERP
jgi:hypothetical protein